MKRLKALLWLSVCMLFLSACNNYSNIKDESSNVFTEEELREKFPEYFDLEAFKGIEVYVWQTAENSYSCGVLSGTNRNKSPEEIIALSLNSATIEEMKAILSFYDIPDDYVIIMPCIQPYSSYNYEIDDSYTQKIKELFDK